jgi:organic hydroperoxide reductase OsmC/OhrA
MDAAAFASAAEAAKDGCPVSNALKGNVAFTLAAKLE